MAVESAHRMHEFRIPLFRISFVVYQFLED